MASGVERHQFLQHVCHLAGTNHHETSRIITNQHESSRIIITNHRHESSARVIITNHHESSSRVIITSHHHESSSRVIITSHHHESSSRVIITSHHHESSSSIITIIIIIITSHHHHHHDHEWLHECFLLLFYNALPYYLLCFIALQHMVYIIAALQCANLLLNAHNAFFCSILCQITIMNSCTSPESTWHYPR